jgi:hypothetical protein
MFRAAERGLRDAGVRRAAKPGLPLAAMLPHFEAAASTGALAWLRMVGLVLATGQPERLRSHDLMILPMVPGAAM